MNRRDRAGFTLVEVLIVVGLVGLATTMVSIGLYRGTGSSDPASLPAELAGHQEKAIANGQRVTLDTPSATGRLILFLPDGRAIGPDLDPLSGLVWSSQ